MVNWGKFVSLNYIKRNLIAFHLKAAHLSNRKYVGDEIVHAHLYLKMPKWLKLLETISWGLHAIKFYKVFECITYFFSLSTLVR